jgi:hypothetical protein
MTAKLDRHKTNYLVRLPPELHAAMKELAAKNSRPLTRELELACRSHLKRGSK